MDSNVTAAIISGICSIASALGAVFLKEYLGRRRCISPTSTTQAREPVQPTHPEVPRPESVAASTRKTWKRPASIVFGSWIFGMVTRAMRPYMLSNGVHYEFLISLVVLIIVVLTIAFYHRKKGALLGFQLENVALWAGFASGWSLVHGGVWGDLLAVTIPWWMGCAIVGGFIVVFRRRGSAQPGAAADG